MKQIEFHATKEDAVLIEKIVTRAIRYYHTHMEDAAVNRLELEMDITATHLNGCPLQLQRWLDADDFNFMHDIVGIRHCLDRRTGQLSRRFLPRFHNINDKASRHAASR